MATRPDVLHPLEAEMSVAVCEARCTRQENAGGARLIDLMCCCCWKSWCACDGLMVLKGWLDGDGANKNLVALWWC